MPTKFEKIEFASEGAVLRGRLYRPSNVTGDVPVVIMAHGFSVLAAYLDDFATDFAQAGFAVLVFDHRNFGESDGTPRYGFDNLLQIRGYRDAINFVALLPHTGVKAISARTRSSNTPINCATSEVALSPHTAIFCLSMPRCDVTKLIASR